MKEIYEQLLNDFPEFTKDFPKEPKFLGGGAYGNAFDIGNSKVLKITKDHSEAKTSAFRITKDLEHTWEINQVISLDDSDENFLIIGEKLEPLKSDEYSSFTDLCWAPFLNGSYDDKIKHAETFEEFKYMYEKKSYSFHRNESLENMRKYPQQAKWLFKALKELSNNDILFSDNIPGNILSYGDSWKLIDLGAESKSPEAELNSINS